MTSAKHEILFNREYQHGSKDCFCSGDAKRVSQISFHVGITRIDKKAENSFPPPAGAPNPWQISLLSGQQPILPSERNETMGQWQWKCCLYRYLVVTGPGSHAADKAAAQHSIFPVCVNAGCGLWSVAGGSGEDADPAAANIQCDSLPVSLPPLHTNSPGISTHFTPRPWSVRPVWHSAGLTASSEIYSIDSSSLGSAAQPQ